MKSSTALSICLIFCGHLLSGCQLEIGINNDTAAPTIPFTVIASGEYTVSGFFENRKLEVFHDQASLDASLAIYVQFAQQHTVNFSTSQAVLINAGQRNSGGHSVKTRHAHEFSDHIIVQTTLTKPGNGCITTLALTSPFEFIEIQSTKEIIFQQNLVTKDCS